MTFSPERHRPMYTWEAKYRDGTTISQLNMSGDEISSDNIDRDQVSSMSILKGGVKVVTLHIKPGQRLFYRRRNEMSPGKEKFTCHMLGWRQRVGNEVIESVIWCFENDHIEMSGFVDDHPWFYKPNFRSFEEV